MMESKLWKMTSAVKGLVIDALKSSPQQGSQDKAQLLYEVDANYISLYERGLAVTGTPDRGKNRRARFYNLLQFFRSTNGKAGAVAECGCWKGLSSYLMCELLRQDAPSFSGDEFNLIDSFEGLSVPGEEDVIRQGLVHDGIGRMGKPFKSAGGYSSSLGHIKKVLKSYPGISYHRGWIPGIFRAIPERTYRFVHIDVDLYEPTYEAVKYFFPRLCIGGVLICDDYGSLFWPGAKVAIDKYCAEAKITCISLSSGQALLLKD